MKIEIEPFRITKKYLIIFIISFIIILTFSASLVDNGKYQYLRSIDYNVQINADGSADVVETWDIFVKNTNTLFKSFKRSSKYGQITDVSVKDINRNVIMNDYGKWVYHAPKDYYYAGSKYASSEFEIGWGADMEGKSGWRKFEVRYTITNVITNYNDCMEFYWQFLGKGQNNVPADKVTGTINLPGRGVSNLNNLMVWAHGEVNGKINKVDNGKVEFNIDNLSPGAMVEVRIVSTEDLAYGKMQNYKYLNNIITEEEKWSSETNNKIIGSNIGIIVFIILEAFIVLINVFRINKLNIIANEKKVKKNALDYYREIPRENDSTPAEALYLSKFYKSRLDAGAVQKNAVASIILDLCLKKKISLRMKDKNTLVKIINEPDGLKEDELEVYKLIKNAGNDEYDIEDLSKYAKKNYYKYSLSINNVVNACRNSLYKLKLIDKAKEKNYLKTNTAMAKKGFVKYTYISLCMMHFIALNVPFIKRKIVCGLGYGILSDLTFILIGILPYIITKIILWSKQKNILGNISVLTQEGSDEKEKWIALKKYMEDYSLLREKEVPDLALWEKYLVYATAFGISDKVIDNLKATYPEVFIKESWDEEKYPILNYAFNPIYINDVSSSSSPLSNIGSSVSRAYSTSLTEISRHSSSGGSGGGGGFSGGCGRRRWPEAGMGGR